MLRFAPTPTQDMNIDDLRVALFNHILSKQLNEELIVRIEDSEKEKIIEGKEKEIMEMLALFGIDFTRAVHQSDYIKYHTQMGMKLLLDKKAFNCFCSDEALQSDKEKAKQEGKQYSYSGFCETISDEAKFNCNAPFVVRLKKPSHNIKFSDPLKGELDFTADDVDSVIILGKEKLPTYNFACAVDDMLLDITTVVRDESQLTDTARQIHIRESLGYEKEINYIHLPTILNNKSDEKSSLSIKSLIDEGFLPAAIANYLVLLGNTPKNDIFTIEEAIEWFDVCKLSKEPVEFDIDKLKSLNQEHLKLLDDMRLSKILGYADTDIGKLAKIYIDECSTIKNIKEKIKTIFSEKTTLDGYDEEFRSLKECLQKAPFIEEFENLKKYITDKTKLSDDKLLIPLSFALTGEANEPKLERIYPLIRNYLGEII
ncbi:MAG: glutamate--tRNA ligase [Campylobacterota bacterium]|nr:glutamate--tRNA ligase [Campylobacterota bacterium]